MTFLSGDQPDGVALRSQIYAAFSDVLASPSIPESSLLLQVGLSAHHLASQLAIFYLLIKPVAIFK